MYILFLSVNIPTTLVVPVKGGNSVNTVGDTVYIVVHVPVKGDNSVNTVGDTVHVVALGVVIVEPPPLEKVALRPVPQGLETDKVRFLSHVT